MKHDWSTLWACCQCRHKPRPALAGRYALASRLARPALPQNFCAKVRQWERHKVRYTATKRSLGVLRCAWRPTGHIRHAPRSASTKGAKHTRPMAISTNNTELAKTHTHTACQQHSTSAPACAAGYKKPCQKATVPRPSGNSDVRGAGPNAGPWAAARQHAASTGSQV